MDTPKKLNLGCGRFRKEGYVNLDCCDNPGTDVVHDLNVFPYPFPDDHFDLIEADHVLEHLDDVFKVMKELKRISKGGGSLIIKMPHFSRGFTHPAHEHGFDVSFPYYFDPTFQGGYSGTELVCTRTRLAWFCQPYLKKTVLSPAAYYFGLVFGKVVDFFANLSPMLCSRLWCFLVGGFEEVGFFFLCKK